MTLQQKRRALAEACPGIFAFPEFMSVRPLPGTPLWRDTGTPVTEREWLYAIHLAEGTLDVDRIGEYLHELLRIVELNWRLCRATESQRIDAFLKVKGLWREGE